MTAGREALAARLEGASPEDILAAAAERHPRRLALACSFGPEDCLLVTLIAAARLEIEVFTLDTGFLFPETHLLWRQLEARAGLRIRSVQGGWAPPDPARPAPWEEDADRCCQVRKVEPLRGALAPLGAWVTGIRREQTPARAAARVLEWDPRFGLEKFNPLAAWTEAAVWERVERDQVPVSRLHARGYRSIGCAPCTSPTRPGEDPRAGRWRGSAKTECGLHPPGREPSGH